MSGKPVITLQTATFPGRGKVLLYFVFEEETFTGNHWNIVDHSKLQGWKGEYLKTLSLSPKTAYETALVIGLGKKSQFLLKKWKDAVAVACRKLHELKQTEATTFIFSELGTDFFEIGKAAALAVDLTNYSFDTYKSDAAKKKTSKVTSLTLNIDVVSAAQKAEFFNGVSYGQLISSGISLTRDLVNEPASALGPDDLVKTARSIATASKGSIAVEVLNRKQCQKLGMGSFLAVAQGSDREPAFIVLKRTAKTPKAKRFCFVGKSIIFDSGGYSLKPADAMMDMKIDMAGGASVLGLFSVLSGWDSNKYGEIGVDVLGILPVCENMVSGRAMRPGDIVRAMNGKTIEILNTDAEGRLALADALVYAEQKLKADYIIDLATLTGACMVALGKRVAGMFSDSELLLSAVRTIAEQEGDELWQLPLYKPYTSLMQSDIAELKNIGGGRYGGAITAAVFLKEFVNKAEWMHLDIAGPAYNDESPYGTIPKGGTGWGVLSLVELVRTR